MTQAHFILPNGQTQTVTSKSYVETLMEIARRANVPGIVGDCGGFMACATCHVYVTQDWLSKLAPQGDEEREILGMTENRRPESRLACQIWLTANLDGLTITPANPA